MAIRVLQIIPTLDRGGAEKQMALLAAGLPRDRFETHVCTLTRGGPLAPDLAAHDIPIHAVEKRFKVDPGAYWRLKGLIQQLAPDIVHTWIFAANSYGRQAAFSAGVRHVLAGERCVDKWKVWHELAIDRWLARRTERLLTNSSGVKEFYVQHGLPAEKFLIIPNGVAPFVRDPSYSRQELLAELKLPAGARLIGAVGRLWPQKRYKDLIWAAHLLEVGRGDAHLLIIGDGPERRRLERFHEQVRDEGNVHFLGHRSDVARLMQHFDCLWLGSGYEGQSNAVMEAMSAGVPVVATDIAGNRDLVVDGQTGFLVGVGNRGEFARKTSLLLDDSPLASQLGAAAQKRMAEHFTVDQMVQRHVELYERLCG